MLIAILALGIAWNVIGIVLQQVMMSAMSEFTANIPNAPPNLGDGMQGMLIAMRIFSAFFALGFAVL